MSNLINIQQPSQGLRLRLEVLNERYEVLYYVSDSLVAKYFMEVKFVKRLKKQFVIEINRMDEVAGGNEGIQNHALDLACACGKILFPIKIVLDEDAKIIAINNHH